MEEMTHLVLNHANLQMTKDYGVLFVIRLQDSYMIVSKGRKAKYNDEKPVHFVYVLILQLQQQKRRMMLRCSVIGPYLLLLHFEKIACSITILASFSYVFLFDFIFLLY
jgi:hypothetical protein